MDRFKKFNDLNNTIGFRASLLRNTLKHMMENMKITSKRLLKSKGLKKGPKRAALRLSFKGLTITEYTINHDGKHEFTAKHLN